jgi:Ni/Co efflux regulator RcnB
MKRMLMAIMAVAVAVTFSAPSFAEEKKDKKDEKKGGKLVQMLNAEEKKDKKDEKKGK